MCAALAACTISETDRAAELDALCDATTGAWTRVVVADEACEVPLFRNPAFDAAYQEANCRATYGDAFAAGTIRASQDAIARCRAALDANTCTPATRAAWRAATAACDQLIAGVQPAGAACSIDEECAAGFCARTADACGTCRAKQPVGAACDASVECASQICGAGTCQTGGLAIGAACAVDAQCASGLACANDHCQRVAALGESCAAAECNVFEGACITTQAGPTCTVFARVGLACSPWTDSAPSAAHCRWYDGEGCVAGACAVLPTVADGARCDFDLARCRPGARCLDQRCVPTLDEGSACDRDEVCGPYALCVAGACRFTDYDATCSRDGPTF